MLQYNTLYGRIRTFILAVEVVFLILFAILVFYKYKQEKLILNSSEQKFISDMNALFEMKSSQMSKSLFDYTYRDEFVTALHKNDTNWYVGNIGFIPEVYDIDYVCLYDKHFRLINEQYKSNSFDGFTISSDAVRQLYKTRFANFFQNINGKTVEVCAASVHPSTDPMHNKTEPEGYLFVVREFDQKFVTDLEKISSSKIYITPSDTIAKVSRFTLENKIRLCGWDGNPVTWIIFHRILDLNSGSTQKIMFTLAIFVLLILLIFKLFAQKWINKPLELVTDILKTDNHESIAHLKTVPAEYGRIGILFDEHLQQKYDLKEAKERAEKSDKLKSAFLANISHEIRTPMNSIMGFTELLETETNEETKNQYLQTIQKNGQILLQLLTDLMDLSKIEAGVLTIKNIPFGVTELFKDLHKIYSKDLLKRGKKNILLEYELPDDEIFVYSDPHRIKQVLCNLLSNAVKFTEKGTIKFSCQKAGNDLIFSVVDTGTGIPEEDQKKIFERFTKFNYKSLNSEGSGIGLSIVERIVTVLNGKIWVKSVVGEGSCFSFSIPVLTDPA